MDITRAQVGDDADPAELAELAALHRAASATDSPWAHLQTDRQFAGDLRYGHDLEVPVIYTGREDGVAVAMGGVQVSEWDNRDLAWLGLTVHPAHRGRGLGSEVLGVLEKEAQALGRTKLGCDTWEDEPSVRFAESHGFACGSKAILRRQRPRDLDLTSVRRSRDGAAAAATAYELVRVVGRTPRELLPALATVAASINDAPTDDLDIEDEVYDAQRVANYEEATLLRNRTLYRLAARHRDTGELVGHTAVAVERETPAIAWQHDTAVLPEHRGHRLGLLLKAEMVLWLANAEPQVETVDTWNAESNDHMVAVNEALGYQWLARGLQFQRTASSGR